MAGFFLGAHEMASEGSGVVAELLRGVFANSADFFNDWICHDCLQGKTHGVNPETQALLRLDLAAGLRGRALARGLAACAERRSSMNFLTLPR
jgi:hypothetical protein